MSNYSFTVLANTRLSTQSRVYPNSCCPDKDLIVLFSRLGGNDRMSLWNITQGTKKWETDIGDSNASCTALAIAWSPDGQSIAVAREPPSVAVYSIQDGHRIHVLPITCEAQNLQLSGVWWFSDENEVKSGSNIPDIFKRNQVITGSAHSVLKILPLLDHLQEDSESNLTATDVFAFQGSHNRSHRSSRLPDVIGNWPTLAADHIAASISTSSYSKSTLEKAELDAMDNVTMKTILLTTDNQGHVFPFLDGLYPLGVVSFGFEYLLGLAKHQSKYLFAGQPNLKPGSVLQTCLKPTTFTLPLLATRKARDLAKLSSTARELMWYLVRVVKEMRDSWCGSESQTGAREFGMKWIQALEEKQKEFCAEDEPDAILDLTTLLTTGRASEALTDFLGSGQDMSERGIHKWESTLTEALVKLRDFGERRCAPGLQRVFLVLDELVGWAKLPQFAVFQLPVEDLLASRDLAGRGIIIASWLAAEARKELSRFREFIHWLRFEVANVVSPNEPNTARHDILEVNHYFISGLTESSIDRWFIGPTPNFTLVDLNIPELQGTTLSQAIDRALKVVDDPMQTAWQMTARANDLRHLDRNLEALVQELTGRCQRIFRHAAGATSRSAVVSSHTELTAQRIQEEAILFHRPPAFPFRERTGVDKDGEWLQHLVVHLPSDEDARILLIQLRLSLEAIDLPPRMGVAILKCILPEEGEGCTIGLLDADFFDDESVIIVYRLREGEKQCYIAMLHYRDVEYQKLPHGDDVNWGTREEMLHYCMELWKNGQMVPIEITVNRRRLLSNCRDGGISLALNGRVGRRVACVLDGTGTSLESFDLEGEGDDVEDADDTAAD